MKYKIASDEWWPVFIDDAGWCEDIELSDEEYQKIRQAFKDFDLAQKIIRERLS